MIIERICDKSGVVVELPFPVEVPDTCKDHVALVFIIKKLCENIEEQRSATNANGCSLVKESRDA